jgi:pyruvate dehydrogenase E2 component (dihydrolipoamide acetyltransferase)
MPDERMAIVIPEGFSLTSSEVKVAQWLKAPGDTVERGEVLAEIETEKATLELEATESGVLAEIVVEDGGATSVGETIAWLERKP